MANPTRKMIEVYEMLKDGKPFKFDTLVSRLGCNRCDCEQDGW